VQMQPSGLWSRSRVSRADTAGAVLARPAIVTVLRLDSLGSTPSLNWARSRAPLVDP
jgi:hypothetical protein